MKGAKHTPGPWKTIVLDGETWINPDRPSGEWALICRVNGRTVNGSNRPAQPNADRIVSCVNGCDAAGVVEPGALRELLDAAATTRLTLAAECIDGLPEYADCHERLYVALRRVRGE